MPKVTYLNSEKTCLGLIRAHATVSGVDISSNNVSLAKNQLAPRLPQGMRVQNCTAFILTISGSAQIEHLEFRISMDSSIEGSPCTGQCLDAQEWSSEGLTVVVGTEDGESLGGRLDQPELEDSAVVDYDKHSMMLRLQNLAERDEYSFHFLVAENSLPEPVESSAWFAVDQSHAYVLRT